MVIIVHIIFEHIITLKNLKLGVLTSFLLITLAYFMFFALVASAQQRKSRDIIEFFKKAGENAIKAISGLIPGGRPTSQLTNLPRGPKIPLNTINEDSIKPVIPYKRNMIGKLRAGKVNKFRFGSKSAGKQNRKQRR